MIYVCVVGEGVDTDSAARHEITGYFEVFRVHETHKVLHDDVYAVLVEVAVITEGEEVEFEALALYHSLARDVTDVQMSEIGLSRFGTEGGELGTIEGHEVLVFGMFVRESLEHVRIVLIAVLYVLITKQGDALQLIFCSHKMFGSKPCFQFFVYTEGGKTLAPSKSAAKVQLFFELCKKSA